MAGPIPRRNGGALLRAEAANSSSARSHLPETCRQTSVFRAARTQCLFHDGSTSSNVCLRGRTQGALLRDERGRNAPNITRKPEPRVKHEGPTDFAPLTARSVIRTDPSVKRRSASFRPVEMTIHGSSLRCLNADLANARRGNEDGILVQTALRVVPPVAPHRRNILRLPPAIGCRFRRESLFRRNESGRLADLINRAATSPNHYSAPPPPRSKSTQAKRQESREIALAASALNAPTRGLQSHAARTTACPSTTIRASYSPRLCALVLQPAISLCRTCSPSWNR